MKTMPTPKTWKEAMRICLEKYDFNKRKQSLRTSSLFARLRMLLSGALKDPAPGWDAEGLALTYTRLFNEAFGLKGLRQLGNGRTIDVRLKYLSGSWRPILCITYYDGACAFQSRQLFEKDGRSNELGISYPISEFGVTGLPDQCPDDISSERRKFVQLHKELEKFIKDLNASLSSATHE